ncbi:MAG: hypothetical protein AAFW98_16180, partial [Pseudomonadota bacterium]
MAAIRRFDAAIAAIALVILVVGLAALSIHTVRSAERVLLPALDAKAQSVARSIAGLAGEAVGHGIPIDRLVRAEDVLRGALDENRDFAFAAILDNEGGLVAQVARRGSSGIAGAADAGTMVTTVPISVGGEAVGSVVIGTPSAVAADLVRDLWIDVAVLLLVAVLVALELTAFAFTLPSAQLLRALTQRLDGLRRGDLRTHPPIAGAGPGGSTSTELAFTGHGPIGEEIAAADAEIARVRATHRALQERAVALGDEGARRELAALDTQHGLSAERQTPPRGIAAVRAPVFLFFFAEEMTRPFLPSFIARYAEPFWGLSTELVIALPIVIFMAIVAL